MDGTIALLNKAAQNVRTLEIPSEDIVIEFCNVAMNMVANDLKMNNLAGAIDTMNQTKAIEDYLKSKIKQQHGKINLANRVVVARFREIREIGWWLDEHVAKNGEPSRFDVRGPGKVSRKMLAPNNGDEQSKPKFFLDELGIDQHQSANWQQVSRLDGEQFEKFVEPYLKNGDLTHENELYFSRLWTFISMLNGWKVSMPVEVPEQIKSKQGQSLYKWMVEGKDRILPYVELISKQGVTYSELQVISRLPFWANIINTGRELRRITKEGATDENSADTN